MRVRDGLQVVYCTNIHAANGWDAVLASLARHATRLQERFGVELGLGLRLSDAESRALAVPEALRDFADFLREQRLYVAAINGFPFGAFHQTPVKQGVFAPDWTERSRLDYTLRLARILAALLPPGGDGGVSTVPLSYRAFGADPRACAAHVAEAALALHRLEDESGRCVAIDLEPEPDGLLERASELVRWYEDCLLHGGGAPEAVVRRHVRACVDTCHAAVLFEEPLDALRTLAGAGIRVGRIQVTAALRAAGGTTREMLDRLAPWSEPIYLHQVAGRAADGTVYRARDLPAVLPDVPMEEVRTHFHVPMFHASGETTADETRAVLESRFATGVLELETYTWEVLPPALRGDVTDAIEREMRWALDAVGGPA